MGVSSSGQDARLSIARREFDPLRPYQVFGSVAKTEKHPALNRETREFDSPRAHQVILG